MKATWIKSSGNEEEVTPKNGRDFQLEELQDFVAGAGPGGFSDTITIVTLSDGRIMVANDEGKLIGLKHNSKGTQLYLQAGGVSDIVGNVLVCDKAMVR